ncbi:MAG: hypothetical protein ACKVX9_16180 [Blastocatellia bacterium]
MCATCEFCWPDRDVPPGIIAACICMRPGCVIQKRITEQAEITEQTEPRIVWFRRIRYFRLFCHPSSPRCRVGSHASENRYIDLVRPLREEYIRNAMAHRIQSLFMLLLLIASPATAGCDAALRALDSSAMAEAAMACCSAGGGCMASVPEIESMDDSAMMCVCEDRGEPMPINLAGQSFSPAQAAPAQDASPAGAVFRTGPALPSASTRAAYSPPGNHTYLLNSTFRI